MTMMMIVMTVIRSFRLAKKKKSLMNCSELYVEYVLNRKKTAASKNYFANAHLQFERDTRKSSLARLFLLLSTDYSGLHPTYTYVIHISELCGRRRIFIFFVTKEELAKLVQGFDKTEILTAGGVTLAGQRHIYLSGTDRVVRAKLGKTGVHCMKTQQAVIVAIYEEPVQPQQAASVVEKLGDYLITCGY
ncbi:hypothetical protein ACKWTF_000546 [Chironomus riparius]